MFPRLLPCLVPFLCHNLLFHKALSFAGEDINLNSVFGVPPPFFFFGLLLGGASEQLCGLGGP